MKRPAILIAAAIAALICPLTCFADDAEHDAALLDDYQITLGIVEGELGLEVGSSEGEAAISDLMGKQCSTKKPYFVAIPLPFGGVIFVKLCPIPEIPCGNGKSCQVTRRGNGCSCQKIPTKTKGTLAIGSAGEHDPGDDPEGCNAE